MKKFLNIFAILMMAFCIAFTACNRCSKPTPEPQPIFTGYNFDEIVTTDYDYIAGTHEKFYFREVESRFEDVLSQCKGKSKVNYIATWFQCGPNVNMIFHTPDTNMMNDIMEFIGSIKTEKSFTIDTNDVDFRVHLIFHDNILECGEIYARNPITFDSCMNLVKPCKDQLHTRALTLRKFLDPREPENPQYIFGSGVVMVDAITGEVRAPEFDDAAPEIKFESGLEPMTIE